MRTKKLIRKLEKAFRRDGLKGLMELAKKDKIRKAVEKAMSKRKIKQRIAELE